MRTSGKLLVPECVGLALALAIFTASAVWAAGKGIGANHGPIVLINVDGSINPATADFIEDSLAAAREQDARALIIELDTPGGLLASAHDIIKGLLGSPVPVIVYVAPSGASAASAGTFVTMAANIAAMAPGTTIGAAHPVTFSASGERAVGQKMVNYTVSFARSIARERGRNQNWAEQAVRHSASIDDSEALRLNVIDIVAPDLHSLLAQASGRKVRIDGRTEVLELVGAPIVRRYMTIKQTLLNYLSDPNLVYMLLIGGLVLLYLEFLHPGVYAPGITGTICLLLGLAGLAILPLNFTGLLLLLLGIGLLAAEAFVPSYGVLGIGGLVAFILGSLFLINPSRSDLVISRAAIAGAAVALAAAALALTWALAQRRRPVTTGSEGLVGEIGQIAQAVRPGRAGWIFVHGEMWRASSERPLEVGDGARVVGVKGMELIVEPVAPPKSDAARPPVNFSAE